MTKVMPEPLSEKVEVYESRSGYYIAHSFGGYAFDWAVTRKKKFGRNSI